LAFHSNYGRILYRCEDIARYWSKIATDILRQYSARYV